MAAFQLKPPNLGNTSQRTALEVICPQFEILLGLCSHVGVDCSAPDRYELHEAEIRFSVELKEDPCRAAFQELLAGTLSLEAHKTLEAENGPAGLEWRFLTGVLRRCAFFRYRIFSKDSDRDPLLSVLPSSVRFSMELEAPQPEQKLILSRFACLRRERHDILIDYPMLPALLVCENPILPQLFSLLAEPRSLLELQEVLPGKGSQSVAAALTLLYSFSVVQSSGESGEAPEEHAAHLCQWEFHDALFHSRSRPGRTIGPWGGTMRFSGVTAPEQPKRIDAATECIPLPTPDLQEIWKSDPPFIQVVENRKSHREFADRSLTISQLGEFLFRTARVKDFQTTECGTISVRPYPSGGGVYELEIYPVLHLVEGAAPGWYRYDPFDHALVCVSADQDDVKKMLEYAAFATGGNSPAVLLLMAARFARLSWKYRAVAYSLIQKHVGVLTQQMYLTASAMGLGCCALGGTDAEEFNRVTGCDFFEETAVGELALGIPVSIVQEAKTAKQMGETA